MKNKDTKDYFVNKQKNLILKENLTIVDKDLFIPKDLNIKIYPGQKIILKNKAVIFLLLHGMLEKK